MRRPLVKAGMDARVRRPVFLHMDTRCTILLAFLLLALPGAGRSQQDADAEFSFVYPAEADYLLLDARRTWRVSCCGEPLKAVAETYRVFGDGRIEIDPAPPWFQAEEIRLPPEVLGQLLHSVDALLDLGALPWAAEEGEADSFVRVRLDRYVTPEHAIYYLDALAVADLDAVFEELATLETWLVFRAAHLEGRPLWVSYNPWPATCEEEYRLKLGHRVLEPAWCSPPAFHREARFRPFGGNDEARRAVRERLRERLQNLPRGLQ